MEEPLPALSGGRFEAFKQTLLAEGITDLMAVSLQTREHNFGVLLFPHAERRMFGSSNLRLLIGLALQIALTLENYVVMHEAQRRTKEYELLTEIGQAISSHLNQDEVLRTVQANWARFSTPARSTSRFRKRTRFALSWRSRTGRFFRSVRGRSQTD